MLCFETISIHLGEGKVRFTSHAPFFVNETAGWISSLTQDPECHQTEPKIVFDTDFSLQIWAGTFSLHQFIAETGKEVFTPEFFLFIE